MTQNNDPAFQWISEPYMYVAFRFDRESFDALKALLREQSRCQSSPAGYESSTQRTDREALKRVFDQIRDLEYRDV